MDKQRIYRTIGIIVLVLMILFGVTLLNNTANKYNQLVDDYDYLVDDYNRLLDEYKALGESNNLVIDGYNEMIDSSMRTYNCNSRAYDNYVSNWNQACSNAGKSKECTLAPLQRIDAQETYMNDLVDCTFVNDK